ISEESLFAQSEPDRTAVEVHQTSRPLRPLPADLRSVSSGHPRGSRRSFNHSRRKAEVADDAQVPAIRRCFTFGRVRYKRKTRELQLLTLVPSRPSSAPASSEEPR